MKRIFPPLKDDDIVIRAMTNRAGYHPKYGLRLGGFLLRESDKSGLSVRFTMESVRKNIPGYIAACRLVVGEIRSIHYPDLPPGLDVIQDKIDHANITGLPPYDTRSEIQNEYLAGELLKIAELIHEPNKEIK